MNALPKDYDFWRTATPDSDESYDRRWSEAVDALAEKDRQVHIADWLAEDPFAMQAVADVIQQISDFGRNLAPLRAAERLREQFELYLGTKIEREMKAIEDRRLS